MPNLSRLRKCLKLPERLKAQQSLILHTLATLFYGHHAYYTDSSHEPEAVVSREVQPLVAVFLWEREVKTSKIDLHRIVMTQWHQMMVAP